MEQVPTDKKQRMPSSRVLEEVIDQAPADYFTVGRIDLADSADVEDLDLQPESAPSCLHVSHSGLGNGSIGRTDENGGDLRSRNPITGIAGCCARAASGQAAAPPMSLMNSRRLLIRSPRRRGRARSAVKT
jgi:hypothetical protein